MGACRQTNATIFVTDPPPSEADPVRVPVIHRVVRDRRPTPAHFEAARLRVGTGLPGWEQRLLLLVPGTTVSRHTAGSGLPDHPG
jgi:hypothetical protein